MGYSSYFVISSVIVLIILLKKSGANIKENKETVPLTQNARSIAQEKDTPLFSRKTVVPGLFCLVYFYYLSNGKECENT